jgi:hypothetical protein
MQAAKIFWKAPWWAKLPPEDKAEIIRTETKLEDLVDVFAAPPERPGGGHNQIPDLRGTKVKHKERGIVALVMGYAYAKQLRYKRTTYQQRWWSGNSWQTVQRKGDVSLRNEQMWYAFFEGRIAVINQRNWKLAGNYEPITGPSMRGEQ